MKKIKELPKFSRPREKLKENGAQALSDTELIAVIFAHNYPSGELKPSDSDLKIQEQLTEVAKILGIKILDPYHRCQKGIL